MINCKVQGGDCSGGNPAAVFEYAHSNGLPDSTCQNYLSINLDNGHSTCQDIDICRDCHPPVPSANETFLENCKAIPYKKYYVSDYYKLSGEHKMKAEIFTHGPISCGIYLSPNLISNYTGGIYSEKVENVKDKLNHEVSVVGYGVCKKTGTPYWVVRNAQGTNWGDMGFLYIQQHTDNLGIELECLAGLPTFEKPQSHFEFI